MKTRVVTKIVKDKIENVCCVAGVSKKVDEDEKTDVRWRDDDELH